MVAGMAGRWAVLAQVQHLIPMVHCPVEWQWQLWQARGSLQISVPHILKDSFTALVKTSTEVGCSFLFFVPRHPILHIALAFQTAREGTCRRDKCHLVPFQSRPCLSLHILLQLVSYTTWFLQAHLMCICGGDKVRRLGRGTYKGSVLLRRWWETASGHKLRSKPSSLIEPQRSISKWWVVPWNAILHIHFPGMQQEEPFKSSLLLICAISSHDVQWVTHQWSPGAINCPQDHTERLFN